ncbi:MAG: hypothetical protein P8Q42_11690 [Flavobacteriales bacterium]|nr:hypothetical protein [Flavobacteriales bacterium]
MNIFTVIFIGFSFVGFTQKSEYDYNIKENNLEKHPKDFSVKLNPIFTDLSNDNSVLGFNTGFHFRMNTVMSLYGGYYGSYFNIKPEVVKANSTEKVYNGVVADNYVPYKYLHGGVTMFLWTEVYEGKSKVSLPSEVRNGNKQRCFLEIDKIDKLRQVGLRIGVGAYQGQVIEKDSEFEGNNDTEIINYLTNAAGNNYSSLKYSLFSGGLSYEKINHLSVNVKDSIGIRNKKNHWRLYGDILYAQNMVIGDILFTWHDGSSEKEAEYDLQKFTGPEKENYFDSRLFGYRVGFDFNSTNKKGYCYGIELGSRPGTGSLLARTYLNIKVGMSFNFNVIKY